MNPKGRVSVAILPAFHFGEDAVLVAADVAGLEEFEAALTRAALGARGAHRVGGQDHTFVLDQREDRVELEDDNVIWRLSEVKREEILEKVAALKTDPGPGHHYVDITGPRTTLVLSRDEYLDLFSNDRDALP